MRLIDADKIKEFADYYTELEGEPLTEREKLLVACVCETICGVMPTAYDVDKVVEQMKENAFYPEGPKITRVRKNTFDGTGPYVRLGDAIAVVKAGMDAKQKEGCSSAKKENTAACTSPKGR